MTAAADLIKTEYAGRSSDEALRLRVGVLLGVDDSAQAALATLNIRTVFDLAASRLFAAAGRLVAAERDPETAEARLNAALSDTVDAPAAVPVVQLARQPIAILRSIGAARAAEISAALETPTVRDLALWPPYCAAKEILAQAFFPEQQAGFDPQAPRDLLPGTGVYPTERVFYRRLLIDTGVPPAGDLVALEGADALDAMPSLLKPTGFERMATGALLTFAQSWFSQGLTLGQLLHSTSLAPGESTRLAMVDWSRRTRAATTEEIAETEQLSALQQHNRALSEVTSAAATEFQAGTSLSTASSTTKQSGSGFGLEIGPLALGGSGGKSTATTDAMSASSSFGVRDVAAQFAQDINDRCQQNASAVRSRRASIVREVSQEEHEAISTRVVTNYNHMHALSVQYYEVVQAFRTTTQLERAERCLFVPVKLVNFRDASTVERWRLELARAALTTGIAQLLAELGTVLVTSQLPLKKPLRGLTTIADALALGSMVGVAAPATAATTARAGAADGETPPVPPPTEPADADTTATARTPTSLIGRLTAAGWNLAQVERIGRVTGRLLLPKRTHCMYVSDDALVIGIALRAGQATGFAVRRQDSTEVAAQEITASGMSFDAPVAITELQSISIQHAGDQELPTALTLHLNLFGTVTALDVPIHLDAGGPTSPLQEAVRFDAGREMRELVDHLEANKLHYSQAILRALDGPQIAAILARFSYRGLPLAQLVDQQPVGVTSNFLVFKMNLPSEGDAEDPRLSAELADWRRFLVRTGLDHPVPKSEVIPLPSGGVFAEAVLGRNNSAERIDLKRFWNWQDSPIPIAAPEIAAVTAGSRAQPEELTPGQLSAPVVNIQPPTALPDPTGIGAAIAALQASNMFRDMSGLAQTAALAQAAQQVSASGATAAMQQAGENLFTVMDQNTQRMRIAAQLAARMAGLPAGSTDGGGTASSGNTATERGGALAQAAELDAKAAGKTPAESVEGETFLGQIGAKGRELANRIISVLTGPSSDEDGAEEAAPPTRGVGPRQAAPRALTAVLHTSSLFMDEKLFGTTPVLFEATMAEPDGRQVWERRGAAAATFTGSLRTGADKLFLNVWFQYELGWPRPTILKTNRFLNMTVAADATRLDAMAWVQHEIQNISVKDGSSTPPDDARLVELLRMAGIDLFKVMGRPEVEPESVGFDLKVSVLKNIVLEQTATPPTHL